MDHCNCQMLTTDALRALLSSDRSHEKEQAIDYLVSLLTSRDEKTRLRGYELFEEGINEALFAIAVVGINPSELLRQVGDQREL